MWRVANPEYLLWSFYFLYFFYAEMHELYLYLLLDLVLPVMAKNDIFYLLILEIVEWNEKFFEVFSLCEL